jgi:hypothetical protein
MKDELAPFEIKRYYDGELAWYHVVRDYAGQRNVIHSCFKTRDEAVKYRNSLNSTHAMDKLAIF